MKFFKDVFWLALAFASIFFIACAGGSTEETKGFAITDKQVAGVSQKGPFLKGSVVTLYELNGSEMLQTGNLFVGKIKSDHGDFSIESVSLASQYALLEAKGYYRNEVSGKRSSGEVTLYAVTDLENRENVNVNLLTHLEYDRVKVLLKKGLTVAEAKDSAEIEILKSFYVDGVDDNFEDLNIFESGKGDAALLAISILLQGDRSESELSELLADYSGDMEDDGRWDNASVKAQIADWSEAGTFLDDFAGIRKNVESWELGNVPQFEPIAIRFWWQNYGLGICNKERNGEYGKNLNRMSKKFDELYVCDNEFWRRASAFEKDVLTWGACKPGDSKIGENTKKLYVCEDMEWREAKDNEYDTYLWGEAEDGTWRQGAVHKSNYYVFDKADGGWRLSTSSYDTLQINGCTTLRNKEIAVIVKEGLNQRYYCYNQKWVDVLKFSWELPKEAYFNDAIEYGSFVDSRDGHMYRTVEINGYVWMAENLNYADSVKTPSLLGNSWCYDYDEKKCDLTGRYYRWSAAIDSAAYYENEGYLCGYGQNNSCPLYLNLAASVRGICPEGWRLPNFSDALKFIKYIGGGKNLEKVDSKRLLSQFGWPAGADEYGFSAIPSGQKVWQTFSNQESYFWLGSAISDAGGDALIEKAYAIEYYQKIGEQGVDGSMSIETKPIRNDAFPVRCIKDSQ